MFKKIKEFLGAIGNFLDQKLSTSTILIIVVIFYIFTFGLTFLTEQYDVSFIILLFFVIMMTLLDIIFAKFSIIEKVSINLIVRFAISLLLTFAFSIFIKSFIPMENTVESDAIYKIFTAISYICIFPFSALINDNKKNK